MPNNDATHRWRQVLNYVLLAGAGAATLVAAGVTIALLWWLSGPALTPPVAAVAPHHPLPNRQTAAVAPAAPVPAAPVPAAPVPAAPIPPAPAAPAPAPAAAAPEPAAEAAPEPPPAPRAPPPNMKRSIMPPPAEAPPQAPAAPVAQAPPSWQPNRRTNDRDAERNREIANGLADLARDPAAQKQLGIPVPGAGQ